VYHPHVTLARSSRARPLRALVDALGEGGVGPGWAVDAVMVMESDTRPSGAVYREVARLPFG
jgi:2'-5' RNA ligase